MAVNLTRIDAMFVGGPQRNIFATEGRGGFLGVDATDFCLAMNLPLSPPVAVPSIVPTVALPDTVTTSTGQVIPTHLTPQFPTLLSVFTYLTGGVVH